ncbi:plasmid pRiA4b ORF-3 family protein [Parafrankia elaeagni]|uniref:plasmid pRiA4b ORF-3 family protein n=1 Tax=Parafrankia elaeagni TaxID=222534 RepID=UPI0003707CCB|nr:plasmid pRiA4b ORF-3 family protein [Parafrankia elaeagni]
MGLRTLTTDMLEIGRTLRENDDPLLAEVAGATFAVLDGLVDGSVGEAFLQEIVPRLETTATGDALAVLLAVGSVASGPVGATANAAAGRLAAAGVSRPGWAQELTAPLVAGDFQRRYDDEGAAVFLSCTVERAGRRHAFLVCVDPSACGEADDILVLPAEDLPLILKEITAEARKDKVGLRTETLDAEEFRWQVENALNARAVHDGELPFDGDGYGDDGEAGEAASFLQLFGEEDEIPFGEEDGQDGPPYEAVALVLRSRLATLPTPRRPPAPHPDGDGDEDEVIDVLGGMAELVRMLDERGVNPAELLAGLTGNPRGRRGLSAAGWALAPPLPKKPKRAKGQRAPVYQVKVGLRGAKPPIWRRLEVPANTSLERLHTILQAAFDWDDSHLHAFETPYGRFGTPDADLDQRAEQPVSLEQVLPTLKAKIRYTYDFGDDWEHEILLEKILEPDPSVRYPRCTGGRRAAPPEDCGGIWGYEALLEILGDPSHPEHDERLEWLGLGSAADLDPTAFDPQGVTAALSRLR